ncbi:MAG: DNA polymerase [Dissulfuribacterales bacterium]
MNNTIEVLQSLGLELKKTSGTNGGEWHGPCPYCKDGVDRFYVTPEHPKYLDPVFYCRQCKEGGSVRKLVKYMEGDVSKLSWKPKATLPRGRNKVCAQKQPPSAEWQKALCERIDNYFTVYFTKYEPYRRRGINKDTVDALHLGVTNKTWNIPINGHNHHLKNGMAIPNYRGDILYSLQIRAWMDGSGFSYCKGSVIVPYHVTKLKSIEGPVVIVESALDAAVLYQEAGDLVHAVAMGSAQNKPDNYMKTLLANTSRVFVCMDYDPAGIEAVKWWHENYPEANIVFSPLGKDIGEYHVGGNSVRDWVMRLLSGDMQPRPKPEIKVSILKNTKVAKELLQKVKDAGLTPGISISDNYIGIAAADKAFAIDISAIPAGTLKALEEMRLIAHDGVLVIERLKTLGLMCRSIECTKLQFLMLGAMIWDLEKLAQFRLGYGSACHNNDEVYKTALDAHLSLKIFEIQEPKIRDKDRANVYSIYARAQFAVAEIRTNGFGFDIQKHQQLCEQWEKQFSELTPESPEYGTMKNLTGTYGKGYARHCDPDTSRIYPEFHYSEGPTGRFSCENPNLQGTPKKSFREVFRAPEGRTLLGADYSIIDLRVAAMLSKDQKMIAAFKNGDDFHTLTASIANGVKPEDVTREQRDDAKAINYAVVYGGQSVRIQKARERLKQAFPAFYEWLEGQTKNSQKKNEIKTPAGRSILRLSNLPDWKKQLCNYPIQGGSQEVLLSALGSLPAALADLDAKIILSVHDEIILEVAEKDAEAAGKVLVDCMEKGFLEMFPDAPISGLVKLCRGNTWADLK